MSNYKVEKVEIRKKKNGEDFLLLNIGDKSVSFFNIGDIKQNVKEGDIVSCKIVQQGTFFNGYNLKILDKVSADTEIDQEIIIDDKKRDNDSILYAGGRKFYFDVKKTSKDENYLIITEEKGENRNSLFVFKDYAEDFLNKITIALKNLKK